MGRCVHRAGHSATASILRGAVERQPGGTERQPGGTPRSARGVQRECTRRTSRERAIAGPERAVAEGRDVRVGREVSDRFRTRDAPRGVQRDEEEEKRARGAAPAERGLEEAHGEQLRFQGTFNPIPPARECNRRGCHLARSG